MAAAIPEHERWTEISGTRTPSGFPTPGVIVGAERSLGSEPPGLSRVYGMETTSPSDANQWVALGIDLRGLAPPDARRSLAWVQERLARGDAFRLDEHEEEVELIRDHARIAQVVEALLAREARGYAMRLGAEPGVMHSVPARLTAEGAVLLDGRDGPLEAPFDVQLEGFHSVYQFQWSGDPVAAPPDTIVRVRRRRQRRARAPFRLRARFTHPLWDTIQVNAPVHDVSLEGLSFDTDAFRDLLYPGLVLRDLEVHWKGGVPIRCEATVRHVTQRAHSGQHRVGVSLDLPPLGAALWQREVEGVLHPQTLRGAHGPAVFWENYTISGYFNLSGKRAEDFAGLRSSFERAHRKLRTAPHVGAAFAYSSERRVESVAHQLSPWEGSWVFYHFSRRPDARPLSAAGDDALLDLYAHAYEYVQQQPRAQYLVTYVQKVARFSSLIFNDLTRRYLISGRASVTEFRALELDTDVEPAKKSERFEIGPARQDETVLASAVIRASRPGMYVAATGLGQADLGIDSTLAAWSSTGLERDRRLLVARHGGRVVAAAVIDIVEQGVHLFGLFDMVRLYAVSSLGHLAFGALLDETRRVFRALGRSRFAYFCDDTEDRSGPQRPGTADLGEATMTILPVGLLPELLEHVFVLTSRRPGSGPRNGSEMPEKRTPSELPPSKGAE
jgi:PilZ domain-containing protein